MSLAARKTEKLHMRKTFPLTRMLLSVPISGTRQCRRFTGSSRWRAFCLSCTSEAEMFFMRAGHRGLSPYLRRSCPATQSLLLNHRVRQSCSTRYIKHRFLGNESSRSCRIPKQNQSFRPQRLQSFRSIICILPIRTEKRSSMICRLKQLRARSLV